jgi:Zn finger protein HypA/HybF involved in hydrogenase expression
MATKRQPEFECQECGKKFYSVAAAERALNEDGCPKCGGSDIDIYLPPTGLSKLENDAYAK